MLIRNSLAIKIGYIDNNTPSTEFDFLTEYIDKINVNQTEKIELIKIAKGDSHYQETLKDTELSVATSICQDNVDATIKKDLLDNNVVLWCADLAVAGDCSRNVIDGMSVIPSLEQCIYFIIIS